ncbi:hypothetical protein H1C71_006445 [Ictidomys tridecemlineatus]|nr:hypothetical protein H1C71_006445 [Ictidomys tridecemlineatus]
MKKLAEKKTLLQPQTWDILPRENAKKKEKRCDAKEWADQGQQGVRFGGIRRRSPCSPCPVIRSRGTTAIPRSLGKLKMGKTKKNRNKDLNLEGRKRKSCLGEKQSYIVGRNV